MKVTKLISHVKSTIGNIAKTVKNTIENVNYATSKKHSSNSELKAELEKLLYENISIGNHIKRIYEDHYKYGEMFLEIVDPATYKGDYKVNKCCFDCGKRYRGATDEDWCSECVDLLLKEEEMEDTIEKLAGTPIETYYWSRAPGKFVNKRTGVEANFGAAIAVPGPVFHGNVREWYETLIETIVDASNVSQKSRGITPTISEMKQLPGGFHYLFEMYPRVSSIFVGEDVFTILKHTVPFSEDKETGDGFLFNYSVQYSSSHNGMKVNVRKELGPNIVVGEAPHAVLIKCLDMNII